MNGDNKKGKVQRCTDDIVNLFECSSTPVLSDRVNLVEYRSKVRGIVEESFESFDRLFFRQAKEEFILNLLKHGMGVH